MRPRLGIVPAVFLGAAGCTFRPWTPSVSVAYWAEDVPPARATKVPTSEELGRAWQVPASLPWSRYAKPTLIASAAEMQGSATLPDVHALEVVARADAAAARVAKVGLPPGSLWLVDLRGAASCAFGARLSRDAASPVAPVVTFNNWPAAEAVVPAEESLAGLIAFAPKLPPPDATQAHPVFLLDSWRLAYRFDDPGPDVFDNRYMLMPGDLPDVETLRAQRIDRVLYVVEDLDDTEIEEDDLNRSFRAWQSAGISIFLVDLRFLKELESWDHASFTVQLGRQRLWVRDRYTLVDDPAFYLRARAGFGLYWGYPFIARGFVPGYYAHPGRGGGYPGGGG